MISTSVQVFYLFRCVGILKSKNHVNKNCDEQIQRLSKTFKTSKNKKDFLKREGEERRGEGKGRGLVTEGGTVWERGGA